MQNEISVGSHARSKSGGCQMIVESKIGEYLVKCAWTIDDLEYAAIFHLDSLVVLAAGKASIARLGGT